MKLFLTFRLISRQVASAVPLSAAASCIIGYNGGVGRGEGGCGGANNHLRPTNQDMKRLLAMCPR